MRRRFCTICRTITEWNHKTHSIRWIRCDECGAMQYVYDKRKKAKRTGES